MLLDDARRFGDALFDAYQEKELDPHAFPDLALAAIERTDLLSQLTQDGLQQIVTQARELPRQRNSSASFGDPPVTLYNAPQESFYIEALYHTTASMAIHDHSFSGAFAVVSGECAHQIYDFSSDDPPGSLMVGELRPRPAQHLNAGIAHPVVNGMRFIHRNVHLDKPTITVVIRTVWDRIHQHSYYYPGLALDLHMSATERKQLQLLTGMLSADEAAAAQYLRNLVGTDMTPSHAYKCIDVFFKRATGQWELDELLDAARSRFGHQMPAVASSLRQSQPVEPDLAKLVNNHAKSKAKG
jgi:hypothetical protein